jgi:hypothetical protein
VGRQVDVLADGRSVFALALPYFFNGTVTIGHYDQMMLPETDKQQLPGLGF